MGIIDTDFKDFVVRLCFDLAEGKEEELVGLVKRMDKTVEHDGNVIRVHSQDRKFTCGLRLRDKPQDQLIPVMYALLGPLWVLSSEGEYEQAKREIEERVKNERWEVTK